MACIDKERVCGSQLPWVELPRTSGNAVEVVGELINVCPVEAPLWMEQTVDLSISPINIGHIFLSYLTCVQGFITMLLTIGKFKLQMDKKPYT